MGAFSDALASDMAALVGNGEMAADATYTPGGSSPDAGTPTAVVCTLGALKAEREQQPDGEYMVYRRSCVLEVAAVASVTTDDTMTIDSVVWQVNSLQGTGQAGVHELELLRRVRLRAQAGSYQRG